VRGFDQSLPMALLKAREAAMSRFRPLMADHDLTEQQWRVLRALAAVDDPIDVGELVDRTVLLGPSLSRILVNLDHRGLIDRTVAAHDQRRTLVSLTALGESLVSRVAPHSEEAYHQIETAYGTDRLHRLLGELSALETALATPPSPTRSTEGTP